MKKRNSLGLEIIEQSPEDTTRIFKAKIAVLDQLLRTFYNEKYYDINIYGERHMTRKEILYILAKKKKFIQEQYEKQQTERENDLRTRWRQA